jgi:hypothetical protein
VWEGHNCCRLRTLPSDCPSVQLFGSLSDNVLVQTNRPVCYVPNIPLRIGVGHQHTWNKVCKKISIYVTFETYLFITFSPKRNIFFRHFKRRRKLIPRRTIEKLITLRRKYKENNSNRVIIPYACIRRLSKLY